MPVGMMRLSTATPEWLEQFRDDADAAGAELAEPAFA